MGDAAPRLATYVDSDIDAILADLNASATDPQQLRDWVHRSGIEVTRVVAIPDLTYVRLVGTEESGGYIVLMLLDGVWERVI